MKSKISWMDIIHKEIREQTKKLVEKWEPTGFLEGIDEENRKHGMGTLLENQSSVN